VAIQLLRAEQICFAESRIKKINFDPRIGYGTLDFMCWDFARIHLQGAGLLKARLAQASVGSGHLAWNVYNHALRS
jgi:hypothetical protein